MNLPSAVVNCTGHCHGHRCPCCGRKTYPVPVCPAPIPEPLPVAPWFPTFPDPRCICNKPMLIYIPPGSFISCPVHPWVRMYGPMVTW